MHFIILSWRSFLTHAFDFFQNKRKNEYKSWVYGANDSNNAMHLMYFSWKYAPIFIASSGGIRTWTFVFDVVQRCIKFPADVLCRPKQAANWCRPILTASRLRLPPHVFAAVLPSTQFGLPLHSGDLGHSGQGEINFWAPKILEKIKLFFFLLN